MRTTIKLTAALFTLIILFNSCEDRRFRTYTANVPIYLSYEELRKSIQSETPREVEQPGKIYLYEQYLFLNEFMEGVHVIDMSDLANPEPVAFIPVKGNIDMAIKDDMLYLDSYTDLVMIDISDPSQPSEFKRMEDILEYTLPPYDMDIPLAEIDREKGVITGWEVKEYEQEISYNPYPYPIYWEYSRMDAMSSVKFNGIGAGAAGASYGVGGSMARFLTYDDYLYMLSSEYYLKVVDITDTDAPEITYDKYIGWGLETMFIYQGYMYLGATDGMYILSLQDPDDPFTTSIYRHITSCDPVVVQDDLAYVTLRSGNRCGGAADLLEVIDISDKYEPERIASYMMEEPYGLGISGTTLFICQGESGLYVYDASDPYDIPDNRVAIFDDISATDVIPVDTVLFAVGDSGLAIYNYSNPADIQRIGTVYSN